MLDNPFAATSCNLFRGQVLHRDHDSGVGGWLRRGDADRLYLQTECSFERFISGYQQVYPLEMDTAGTRAEPQPTRFSSSKPPPKSLRIFQT